MNDRTRWEDQRRDEWRSGQQSGYESGTNRQDWNQGSSRQHQQDWGQQDRNRQQGGWDDDYRRQQQQRDFGGSAGRSYGSAGGNWSERAWGGSSGSRQTGSQGYDEDSDARRRGSGAMGGASGYGWTSQGDADRQSGGRDWDRTRDWSGDWGGSDRGSTDWRTRDNWRNPGSQSFASDYGMRDGQNYDERFRRQGFAGAGGASEPGFGRGYGPDYGRDRSGSSDRSGPEGRERGFLERAGDEIASWFGSEDASRRREQDYRGHGPSDYTRSDERIREDVNDRLTDDPRVDARRISVSVDKGEVTLAGTVGSREAKRRAEDCIDRISGVKHVQNNLRVEEQHSGSYYAGSGSTTGGMSTTGGGSSGTSPSSGSAATGSGATGASTTGTTSGITGGSSGSSGGSTAGASGSTASATGTGSATRKDS